LLLNELTKSDFAFFDGMYELMQKLSNSYTEAYCGIRGVRTKEGRDPEFCMYANAARLKSISEGEMDCLLEIMRKTINAIDKCGFPSVPKTDGRAD